MKQLEVLEAQQKAAKAQENSASAQEKASKEKGIYYKLKTQQLADQMGMYPNDLSEFYEENY